MSIPDFWLYAAATVCFLVAALPHKLTIKPEWLGVALVVAAQL